MHHEFISIIYYESECKEGILHERDHIGLSKSWSGLR
jgi:hypothetical protein